MKTSITWRFTVITTGSPDDDKARRETLDEHLDAVMDELVALTECNPQVHDPGIGTDLSTGEVEFVLLVDGSDAAALDLGQGVLRSAIHAAGGHTPNWDGSPDVAEVVEYSEPSVNLEPAAC